MPRVPLKNALDPEDLSHLRGLGTTAHRRGTKLWLVGGPVRDVLLGRAVVDLDLVSESEAVELGTTLASEHGGEVLAASQFGTVKLRFGKRTLDLATARTETYAKPGALPTVTPSDVVSDLARRDFSINAMAASLSPADFGELLDTQGGVLDLESGRVRVLHDRSFLDDPTRMFRAVRYITRLGFHMDRRTISLLRRDLPVLSRISASRVHMELNHILREPLAPKMLLASQHYGLLNALDPSLTAPTLRHSLMRASKEFLSPQTLLGVLTYHADAVSLTKRLGLTSTEMRTYDHVQRLRDVKSAIKGASLAEVARITRGLVAEAIQACAVASPDPDVRKTLRRYIARIRAIPRLLSGRDILALAVPQGPRVGALLGELRQAQLVGKVRSRPTAVAFVKRLIAESHGSGGRT